MLKSTLAGDASSNQGSSVLYMSYRPTSLVQVGASSVQRLRAPIDSVGQSGDKSRVSEFTHHRFNSSRPATGVDRSYINQVSSLNRTEKPGKRLTSAAPPQVQHVKLSQQVTNFTESRDKTAAEHTSIDLRGRGTSPTFSNQELGMLNKSGTTQLYFRTNNS